MQKFCTFFCNPILQPHQIKVCTSPIPKCYSFFETSHDPWLESQLRCRNFASFLQPYFATPLNKSLQKSYPRVLYLFWKPLMIPDLNPNSDAKISQIFETHPLKEFAEFLPPSVIPFWKPLMIPDLNLNSDANFLQFFGNPTLQLQNMKTSRSPITKCL